MHCSRCLFCTLMVDYFFSGVMLRRALLKKNRELSRDQGLVFRDTSYTIASRIIKRIFSPIRTRTVKIINIFATFEGDTLTRPQTPQLATNQKKETHIRFQGATQRTRADINA